MKNQALKTLLFCLLIPALSGCQKTVFLRTAKGVVVDATTNEPIPFAQVSVYRETSEFLGPTHRELEASVFTNEKGEFEIKFHKTNQGANRIYAKKENYDEISGLSDDDVKDPEGRKSLELKLQRITVLKVFYKKCLNYQGVYCLCSSGEKFYFGTTVVSGDFAECFPVNGNDYTIIHSFKKKRIDSQLEEKFDTVFCATNMITNFIINY